MNAKEGENCGFRRGKAIIGIALVAILLVSIFGALVPTSARDGTGAIERGDTVYCGEKGLDVSAIVASGGYFYGMTGTTAEGAAIFVADNTDFDVSTSTAEGPYNVTSAAGTVADIVIDDPEITGDVFIEGTTYSIVGKTIPRGTKLTVHIEPNFGGLMKNAADGSWSKVRIKLLDPYGIQLTPEKIDADTSEINVTSSDWFVLDTSDWHVGLWKVWITTDRDTCNDVDVSSPYYEFTVRKDDLTIDAEEDAVAQGEDINVTVTGNPLTYYYLTVTYVDTANPPMILYTSDIVVLDEWGDAYPSTGTPNLAAWIETGCDCTATVSIDTTFAAEKPYRITVYDAIYPVYPDFVPDAAVGFGISGSVDVWVGPHETLHEDEWNQTFGGSERDRAYAVQQTADGGFILAGYKRSYGAGDEDFWLVKTDSSGTELWNNTFGGPYDEEAWAVQQTTDGGYILTGFTESYGVDWDSDFWLVKTDSDGNELWNRTFGGPGYDEAYAVQQTIDGGYILAGTGFTTLLKTDSYGNELWNRTFGGPGYDEAYAVQQTTDGGYVLAGLLYHGLPYHPWDADFLLVKTDSGGNAQWNQTYGGFADEEAWSVRETEGGGYILAGWTNSYGVGDEDFWLVKTDSNGNELWNKTFGGPYSDEAYSVQQTVDGGYILAGGTSPYDVGGSDFWLVKTDSNGNEQWNMTFGSTGNDEAQAAQETADGGYILAGYTSSYGAGSYDAWLVKVARELPITLTALFTYTPTQPLVNQTITFDASLSYDPDGTITNYQWGFGDGNITNTTGAITTYSYAEAGLYTVNLTITNNTGAKEATSKVVKVIKSFPPIPAFTYTPNTPKVNQVITLGLTQLSI